MSDPASPRFAIFEPAQRRVIVLVVLLFSGYLLYRLAVDRRSVPDPQPRDGPRATEVADRIDPNTADVATLSALPQLGEKRARDIIAYRERAVADHPDRPAFTRVEDLLRIRGIGYALMSQIRPYLLFPATQPTTTPAS